MKINTTFKTNRKGSRRLQSLVLSLMAVTAIGLTACGNPSAATTVQTTATTMNTTVTQASTTTQSSAETVDSILLTAEEGKAFLEATPTAILVDVRTEPEYKEIRIPGSILIPLNDLPNRLSELPKDPSKPIVVYCRSGNRSSVAASILVEAGFPAVYDLGGIIDWPYETEKG